MIYMYIKSTSTSLFTGGTFYLNLNIFNEYLIQPSLKTGGTKDQFRWVKYLVLPVIERPGTYPFLWVVYHNWGFGCSLTPLSKKFQLYRGGQFIGRGNRST